MAISKIVSVVFLLFSVGTTYAAGNESPDVELVNTPCSKQSAVSVSFSADSIIMLNGKAVSLEGLSKALSKLPATVKEVCYNRANPESYEPPPIAMKALEKIMATRLPVSFYWDANFQKRVVFK